MYLLNPFSCKKKKKKNQFLSLQNLDDKLFRSFIIIYPNLREFGQVIVRYYLWNPPDRISGWVIQFLFGQVGLISGLSQSPKNLNK
jgi:hypothetical protein